MTEPVESLVRGRLAEGAALLESMLGDECVAQIGAVAEDTADAFRAGNKLLLFGNGGSAADAIHVAAEFVGRYLIERRPLPAIALVANPSALTAIGNDYGFENVFARQLAGKATDKDLFLGITTSGNSPNILRALEECRRLAIPSIVFTGHAGGAARALADHCILAPGTATSAIQELHILLAHTLCECVESALFD